jgi:phosphate transport system substrate-binding protein
VRSSAANAGGSILRISPEGNYVKLQRPGIILAGLVAGALALAACGSDDTSGTTGGQATGGSSANGGTVSDCASGSFTAAGSSAQKPAFNAWKSGYEAACSGASINYDGQGSGYGRTQFYQGQVPLAGSDAAIADADQGKADTRCTGGKAVDIPMVITPVAIVYNVQGVSKLTLTPTLLAKIFSGKISKWNDPAIVAANSGTTLPATTITTVHRSSDSGTTQNFARFLDAQAKADWTYGTEQSWKAPGGQGAKDSAAMVQQVKGADGAIGYVDGPDAVKNSLTPAALDTGSGPVELNSDSVSKAVAAATATVTGQDIKVAVNYGLKDAGAYPAILVTYEITCTKGLAADQAKFVKSFLTYTASDAGQAALAPIGHSPLPADLLSKVKEAVAGLSAA